MLGELVGGHHPDLVLAVDVARMLDRPQLFAIRHDVHAIRAVGYRHPGFAVLNADTIHQGDSSLGNAVEQDVDARRLGRRREETGRKSFVNWLPRDRQGLVAALRDSVVKGDPLTMKRKKRTKKRKAKRAPA